MFRMCLILLITLLTTLSHSNENWPQFRGSDSMGVVADNPKLPEAWSATQNVAWKTDIPGLGWSSPIVWGNKIFLTTAIKEGEVEEIKKGLYFGGERPAPKALHQWMVYCIDFETGDILWQKKALEGVPKGPRHLKNTYASETAVTDGERLYAYFGNVGLFVYDMNGKPLWSKTWPPVKTRYGWGLAASPILYKDNIYILNDNDDQSFLEALNKKTGDPVWRVERDEGSNWSTPYIWENKLRTEIITTGTDKVRSYDLDGNLLWSLSGMSSITVPVPFAKSNLLYISSGYVGDRNKPLYAVRPGASGDISLKESETQNKYIAWSQKIAAPYMPTPILYGDYVYVLLDQGFLACYNAKTGEEVYPKTRIAKMDSFTTSPWAYNGKIFCLSENGVTYVIQAGKEFKIIAKNNLDELCMSTPAIANQSLIIRTATKLYRIQK